MAAEPFVESRLVGFFEPGFVSQQRVEMRIGEGARGMLAPEATPPTRIHDARHMQAAAQRQTWFSEAGFFERHGFVLLAHESAVGDWDAGPIAPDSELALVYRREVEELIRNRLLPGRRIDVWQTAPMRRGPGTPNPDYALGVHQDFGLTPADYQKSIEVFADAEVAQLWRSRYERDEVEGFLSIDFWRTAGMRGPLQHMPLALCHPATVRVDDVVPTGLVDFAPTGMTTVQSGLRYDAGQRWYYYPEMTSAEVLVFKQFECFKAARSDVAPRLSSCFHSAFELPQPPADAETRQSSEHRVLIFYLTESSIDR